MNPYRNVEITSAISEYYKEMSNIQEMEMEIMRQKQEAWRALQLIICAERPDLISSVFDKDTWKYMPNISDNEF